MDTDYLTQMAYQCIIYADDATDVLKSELGAACSNYRTEDEYLNGILQHVKRIEKRPQDYLDERNLLDETDIKVFKQKIKTLREHIDKTLATPIGKRGKRRW
ncbi:MAG: hypothetical protein EHM36_11640 [Deltaproteobacteria bacterium]|nr:MAG: hypothetical protein EHM36_11640 [Deltaproteobacteria bacterium]